MHLGKIRPQPIPSQGHGDLQSYETCGGGIGDGYYDDADQYDNTEGGCHSEAETED